MKTVADISREKLELALETIRKDTALLQRDLAFALANRTRWIFIVLWVSLANLLGHTFEIGLILSLLSSGIIVFVYGVVDTVRINKQADKISIEPLDPKWDTKVDLS